jgi:hypothetical protein
MGSGGTIRDDVLFADSNGWRIEITRESPELEPHFSSCRIILACGCLPKINDDRLGTMDVRSLAMENMIGHTLLIFHQRLFLKARYRRGISGTSFEG